MPLRSLDVSVLVPNCFLVSQLAMDSSVSWRSVWCLRTCQQGMKTVQISMTKMQRQILSQECQLVWLGGRAGEKSLGHSPLRWDEILIHGGHAGDIEGDEPHGRCRETVGTLISIYAASIDTLRSLGSSSYPAMQQLMVWSCQPWVSRMPRDRQSTMGATTQAQTNCQTIEGHHSQPRPCFMAISMGVLPLTSVPGMPKSGWNLREMR